MTTSTQQRFRYAKRPIIPGAYHVWTHDGRKYLGCVYRLDDVRDAPMWAAGGSVLRHHTRESAAHELLELVTP